MKYLVLLVVKQLMEFGEQDKMIVVDFDWDYKFVDFLLVLHDELHKFQGNFLGLQVSHSPSEVVDDEKVDDNYFLDLYEKQNAVVVVVVE